jgi:hypothetical protein
MAVVAEGLLGRMVAVRYAPAVSASCDGSVKKLQRDVPRLDGLSIGRVGKVSSMRIAWSHTDTPAESVTDTALWIDGVGTLPSAPPRIAAPRAADVVAATTPVAVRAA